MPQIPKKFTVDVIVIACIVVMIIFVPLIFFVGLMPLFLEEPIKPPPVQQKPINVEVKVPSQASPGENITLNITVISLVDEPVTNLKFELFSSDALVGTSAQVSEILPRMSKEILLGTQVKDDAPLGLATTSLIASVGNYSETELIQIEIVE